MSSIDQIPVPRGAGLFHLPVGRPVTPSADHLHVMDGDGASLCERVDAGELIRIHELRWRDVPLSLRCPACRALMQLDGVGSG